VQKIRLSGPDSERYFGQKERGCCGEAVGLLNGGEAVLVVLNYNPIEARSKRGERMNSENKARGW